MRACHAWRFHIPVCYNISALVNLRRGYVVDQTLEARVRAILRSRGIARSKHLEAEGISRTQIRRLLNQGVLERVGWGLYRDPDAPQSERADLAEAARRVPGGVMCLLTALRFHGLTTVNPFEVWIAIDRKAWRPEVEHPPLRFVYLSGRSLSEGVEEHRVDGVPVRVYSAAKTIADCFKFRNKVGIDVAVEALRAYRETYPSGLEVVWRFAGINRVERVIRPYLEAVG